jgi:hypothetical protein
MKTKPDRPNVIVMNNTQTGRDHRSSLMTSLTH